MLNAIGILLKVTLKKSIGKRTLTLRADTGLISLSIIIFVAAMVLEGLLFLSIIGPSLKAQVETLTAYIFTTSIVMLAVVGISSVFKRKF